MPPTAARGATSLLRTLEALPADLTERARKALGEFRALLARLSPVVGDENVGAGEAVATVLEVTGLFTLYENSADPQDEARHENLNELLAAAREHERAARSRSGEGDDPSAAGFLDAVTLRADATMRAENRAG